MHQLHHSIHELITLHESLVKLSHDKVTQIKQGDMDKLAKLLVEERKLVQSIANAEDTRQHLVNEWMVRSGNTDKDQTMTSLLETLSSDEDREHLEAQLNQLIQLIIELRHVEQLNKDLLEQSMQFVQFSLDMLQPSIHNLNYDGKQQVQDTHKQSVFDSKA